MNNEINLELLEQLKKQFEKIQESENFEPDDDYIKELDSFIENTFTESFEQELNDSINTRKVNIKKLHPDAVFPSYAYPLDSGFDLHSVEEVVIPALGRSLVPTGLSLQFGEGMEIQVRPKSGLAIKQGLTVLNTPGTVDANYTGEIKVIVFNTNQEPFTIQKGMKIAQAVLCPVVNGKFVDFIEVDDLEETDRNEGGFGSTGLF